MREDQRSLVLHVLNWKEASYSSMNLTSCSLLACITETLFFVENDVGHLCGWFCYCCNHSSVSTLFATFAQW